MKQEYAIVVEQAPHNYAAYASDVLGCVTTGDTVEETIALMREALEFHFERLAARGEPIPPPRTRVALVEVRVPAPTAS